MGPMDIIIYGKSQSTHEAAPLVVIKTDQFDIKKYTDIPVRSMDVVIHKPMDPLTIDLRNKNLTAADAVMVNVGADFAFGGGTGGNMQAVFINKGNDQGVYFYGPSTIDGNIGLNAGAGVTTEAIDFNENSGQTLNRNTFAGSHRVGLGGLIQYLAEQLPHIPMVIGAYREVATKAPYYSGSLIGLGVGGDVGLQYTYSNSQIIPALSIPKKRNKDD